MQRLGTRKFSSRLRLLAWAILPISGLIVAINLWAFDALRKDAATVALIGRARKQNTDVLYLSHRLFNPYANRIETENALRLVIELVEQRYQRTGPSDERPALKPVRDPELRALLYAHMARWRNVERPALERLLAQPSVASTASDLRMFDLHARPDSDPLGQRLIMAEAEVDTNIRRLQLLQASFFAGIFIAFAGLLWLARSISLRARLLAENSERLATGDLTSFPALSGNDELADLSESFGSAVTRIRSTFETEREALEGRLHALLSMNTALAGGTVGYGLGNSGAVPAVRGSIPPSSPPPDPAPLASGSFTVAEERKRQVLLVDDDPSVLRSFSRVLRVEGFVVKTAESAKAAIDELSKESFDVILSDIAMPDMDGIQFLREVRARDLLVPVVLVTGSPAVSTAAQAVELGAFQYLVKPVDKESLRKVIDHAARVHEVTRARQRAAEMLGQDGAALGADRAGLEAAFTRAIDGLWIAFQPIVDLQGRRVFGYEALLRSNEASLPHPGAIVDAAERLGRLETLGRAVRARAAQDFCPPNDPALFVNLHVRDLLDPSLVDPEAPLSKIASRVVLEITERSSLEEVRDARLRAASLREMGFRIAVDDMGAGYAGLSSFALLEPEIVKLDMSLVRDVHKNITKQRVIRSMTQLSLDMGILVIAEGVETVEEQESLASLGCNLLQGYLFAKPARPFPAVTWPLEKVSSQAG